MYENLDEVEVRFCMMECIQCSQTYPLALPSAIPVRLERSVPIHAGWRQPGLTNAHGQQNL